MAEGIRAAARVDDTAGQAAVADVPTAVPTARAADVRAALAGRELASATEIAVLDDARLVGIVPIERPFGSGPLATVIQDLLSIVAYFAVASLLVT